MGRFAFAARLFFAAALSAALGCSGVLTPNPPPSAVGAREEAPAAEDKPPRGGAGPAAVEVDFAGAFVEDFAPRDTVFPEAGGAAPLREPSLRYPDYKMQKRPARVQVRRGVKEASVFSPAQAQVRSAKGGSAFKGNMRIEAHSGGTAVIAAVGKVRKEFRLPCTLAVGAGADPLKLGGDQYRGSLIIAPDGGGAVMFINSVDVEDYLRGVVPLEIGDLKEPDIEAAKAQAVAARTYAYKRMAANAANAFDLVNTVADQVYGGAGAEAETSDLAVLMTKDLVMVYGEELVNAYYHSTCGGATANAADVWGGRPQPYLVSVRDVDSDRKAFCAESNSFTWTEIWSADQLAKIIKRYSAEGSLAPPFKGGAIRGLEAPEYFECGRVKTLVVTSGSGERHVTGGDKARFLLRRDRTGYPILRSSKFGKIETGGGQVTVTGRGYGHGIGMCQTGAIGRARAGQDFERILGAYYSGVSLRTAAGIGGGRPAFD
jgi:stage II sporulation protein D